MNCELGLILPKGGIFLKNFLLLLTAAVLLCGFVLCGCGAAERKDRKKGAALFSWSDDVFESENTKRLMENMDSWGVTVLFQAFPGKLKKEELRAFMAETAGRGITVYLLTGEPEWGLDPSGSDMAEEVERAAAYNRILPADAQLAGVLMDTEPYLTEEWDDDMESVMDSFVSGMREVRRAARGEGLELVGCIPYYYDTKGLEAQLSALIQEGCDGLAIMNYYKEGEAEHIKTEMRLANDADIPVTVVYELKAPGEHGLTEKNTYYAEGLEGVRKSVRAMEKYYGTGSFLYALHDYEAVKEAAGRE